jgi:hypothetical protein
LLIIIIVIVIVLGTAHILRKALMYKYIRANEGASDKGTINSSDRIAAKLYSLLLLLLLSSSSSSSSLALQPSASYGLLVSRGFLITHNDASLEDDSAPNLDLLHRGSLSLETVVIDYNVVSGVPRGV